MLSIAVGFREEQAKNCVVLSMEAQARSDLQVLLLVVLSLERATFKAEQQKRPSEL